MYMDRNMKTCFDLVFRISQISQINQNYLFSFQNYFFPQNNNPYVLKIQNET